MTGPEARFVELYDLYYMKVVRYCRRRVDADVVDDAVAEVFLTAWRRIADVPVGPDALPWLYRVAYRAVGHQYRSIGRNRKLKQKLSTLGIAHVEDSADLLVMDYDSRQIVEALSRLSRADQELLRLTVWEELTSSQIAVVLGISEAAAKKRSSRARAALVRSYQRLERSTTTPTAQQGGAL